ncbi:MAG: APC family permease [Solirubrobacterales bacterium]|nr:APC family permease [Solirubrobacterales bacterium]
MAERIPRDQSLSRIYGTGALFSAAYGNVGSSIYYALGVTAAFALGLTPLAFILAGVIFIFTAATYAEATVMYPEAGGSSSFARHAFNELVSFIAAWGQMLNYTITVAISSYFVPHYFAAIWPPLAESPYDVIAAAAIIGGLAVINVRGGQESARLNTVLAVADVITQLVLVAVGFLLVFNTDILISNIHLGVAPTWGDFALGVAVGMIAYTGIETISNMSEEARDAARTVPRGVGLTVLVVMALYLFIPVVALSAMPVTQAADGTWFTELGSRYADDPMLGIVQGLGLPPGLTSILNIYVGSFAGIILIVATNAGLIGVSRLSYSMGQHRQLPESIRRIHPRYRTPWIAIVTFACIATITMLPGQASFLATMYAFGAMLSFTIAHAAVIRLRWSRSEVERPWKPPMNLKLGSHELPMTAVLGGIGTAAAWVIVMVLNPITLTVGSSWLVIGVVGYLLYRRHQKLPVTRTVKVVLPEPLGVEEIEYRSVLVALPADQPFSPDLIATASKLTSSQSRAIHIVALLTVPPNLPLDGAMKSEERLAREKIERARMIAGTRITGRVERVRPGEEGYFLARAARKLKAEAVVLGLESRGGAPHYGHTLEVLMRERPCRVIVVTGDSGSELSAPGVNAAAVGAGLPEPAVGR